MMKTDSVSVTGGSSVTLCIRAPPYMTIYSFLLCYF